MRLRKQQGAEAEETETVNTPIKTTQDESSEGQEADAEHTDPSDNEQTADSKQSLDKESDSEAANKGEWCSAKELTGLKKINGIRHYRVVWENETEPPTWIREENVSDLLKQNYHIRHTQQGAVRKALKRKKRQFI